MFTLVQFFIEPHVFFEMTDSFNIRNRVFFNETVDIAFKLNYIEIINLTLNRKCERENYIKNYSD